MSTMALNLPMNYVEVDRDEMEYIDGAGWVFDKWGTITIPGWVSSTILAMGAAAGGVYLASLFTAIGGKMAVAAASVVINKGISAIYAPITIAYGLLYYKTSSLNVGIGVPYAELA